MASDFIERLRGASFPTARRGGYEPEAVDAYLRDLADWLETGGDDQTRAALVQREMTRVGERTGSILSVAQESADRIVAEARAEAAELRNEAERGAAEARSSADSYAADERSGADEHVRISAEAATREAAELRGKADAEAKERIGEARSLLERAKREAAQRRARAEADIAELLRARGRVVGNLEGIAAGIGEVVEGPGSSDLDLPAGLDETEESPEAEAVAEHPLPPPQGSRLEAERPSRPEPQRDVATEEVPDGERAETELLTGEPDPEEPTRTLEAAAAAGSSELEGVYDADADEPAGALGDEYDTGEQERARERELERRRDPRSAEDPLTEDEDLNDFL